MKAYRAGIIGCGRPSAGINANMEGFSIAYSHANAYQQHGRIDISGVADISPENARSLSDQFHVPSVYQDYREMIEREKLDIVSICTWPTLHQEMTVYAAQAGVKMIWCEKPMAVGLDEIDHMLAICREYGTRLFINHQRRYGTSFCSIREMIDDGALGKIERLEAWVGDGWDLMSWGTHWVDMFRFLMHDLPVEWVLAQAPTSSRTRYGHPIEDHMLLQLQFTNGVVGFIHLGNHLNGAGLRVIGSEGTASLGEGFTVTVQHQHRAEELMKTYVESKQTVNEFTEAIKELIIANEQNIPCEIDGMNGGLSTEIVMAAYQSAMERKKITIPIEKRSFNLLRDFY